MGFRTKTASGGWAPESNGLFEDRLAGQVSGPVGQGPRSDAGQQHAGGQRRPPLLVRPVHVRVVLLLLHQPALLLERRAARQLPPPRRVHADVAHGPGPERRPAQRGKIVRVAARGVSPAADAAAALADVLGAERAETDVLTGGVRGATPRGVGLEMRMGVRVGVLMLLMLLGCSGGAGRGQGSGAARPLETPAQRR